MRTKNILLPLLMLCIAFFAMVGCSTEKTVEYITDITGYAGLHSGGDKIDVIFENGQPSGFPFTIEDEDDIDDIVDIVLTTRLSKERGCAVPGENTVLTIYQGEESYSFNVTGVFSNNCFYRFSASELENKISAIAREMGAFDFDTDNSDETKFYGLEIVKIETSWQEGLAAFPGDYQRTFDFRTGEVYDTRVTSWDISEILENTDGFTAEDFNNPKQVAVFTEEQAKTLCEKIKSLGFLGWKEKYETDDIIDDGGDACVQVYFSDGTVKSTRIYFEYPPNYKEIRKAFEDDLGVNFFYEGW